MKGIGKRIVSILTAFVCTVSLACPMYFWASVKTEAASQLTVKRTADIVFLIDTTGSMGNEIANVRKNIGTFVDKISAEDVDVRVRLISFRDGGYSKTSSDLVPYNPPITYPNASDWYNKNNIQDAKAALKDANGPFQGLGGGSGESPLVPLADMLKTSDYFERSSGEETTGKFVVLLTDEKYESATEYVDNKQSGAVTYGDSNYIDTIKDKNTTTIGQKLGIVEKMQDKGINMSVVTSTNLFPLYEKFVTPKTIATSNDGGMIADIEGNFDILFEELAQKVITVTEQKVETIEKTIKHRIPVKVAANMIVLKKDEGCKYQIAEGEGVDPTVESLWTKPIQESCVFKGLKPSTKYSFRVLKPNGSGGYDLYDKYSLETESSTGANFGQIPKTVYEGEVYNIKLNSEMKKLLVSSGASITWSCASDCVSVKKDTVGNGCQMEIIDCEYNNENLLKITLVADIIYSIKGSKGVYSQKSKIYKQTFSLLNTVDALEVGTFHGTSENTYKDGIIVLTTKEKVSMDVIINQGEKADTASKQKLKYYISDKYGDVNKFGKKIATVDGKGNIKGVGAGLTYITIATADSYSKLTKSYGFCLTIPILCPEVNEVGFDETLLKNEDSNILYYTTCSKLDTSDANNNIIQIRRGSSINLREYLKYNESSGQTDVFNVLSMKQSWFSSDKEVVTVDKKGLVKAKNLGYATVTVSPEGGLKISALTGKRDVNALPCSATIMIQVIEP